MTDSSNAQPAGGYLAPLLPAGWLGDAPSARALLGTLDGALEQARVLMDALAGAHTLDRAAGADLEDLASLLDLRRATGESDAHLRARIAATARHGVSASAAPDMVAYLEAALGLPVVVDDDLVAGRFTVTVLGTPAIGNATVGLIRSVKAAGTIPSARAMILSTEGSGPASGRAGDFRCADASCGGSGRFIPLVG